MANYLELVRKELEQLEAAQTFKYEVPLESAQDGVVRVLVDEVAVRAEHAAVRGPAEVTLGLAFVHESLGEEERRAAVSEGMRGKRFRYLRACEVPAQQIPDARVLKQHGGARVMIVHP